MRLLKGLARYQMRAALLTDGTYRTNGTYMSDPPISLMGPIGPIYRFLPRCASGPQRPFAHTPNAERQTPNAKRQTPNVNQIAG
jgi:hypothetical protein